LMLTDRQQQIWNYLVEYVDRHGYPPTVREIGEHPSGSSAFARERRTCASHRNSESDRLEGRLVHWRETPRPRGHAPGPRDS